MSAHTAREPALFADFDTPKRLLGSKRAFRVRISPKPADGRIPADHEQEAGSQAPVIICRLFVVISEIPGYLYMLK